MIPSWKELSLEIARVLGVVHHDLSTASWGAIVLARAGAELSHCAAAGADLPQAQGRAVLLDWLRLVDHRAQADLVTIARKAFPERDPRWLGALAVDAEASATMPGALVLLALLRLVPRSQSGSEAAWAYVDGAARFLGVERDLVSKLYGWLTAAADADVVAEVELLLARLEALHATAAALVASARAGAHAARSSTDGQPYLATRDRVRRLVAGMGPTLDALKVDRTRRQHLLSSLESDHFRLAVLGEFKRGKSTLINALVGVADLMPTDILPCTSALTEIRFAEERRFEVNPGGPIGRFIRSNEATFRDRAGAAAATARSTEKGAEEAAERVPYWRVFVPSAFLQGASVAVIDSPGLGEDYARNFISRAEAERADAAILVFDINQAASIDELDLIERMKSKAGDLLVVINRADSQPEEKWERVRQHAIKQVRSRTTAIADDRFVLLSASRAEAALRTSAEGQGPGDDGRPWLVRLEALRQLVQTHLLSRAGGIKLSALRHRVASFIADTREAVAGQLAVRRTQLAEIERLEEARQRSERSYKAAEVSISTGRRLLADATDAGDHLAAAFLEALPELIAATERDKATWTSTRSPITSPKAHVQDVGSRVRVSFLAAVEEWMRARGGEVVREAIDARYHVASEKLGAFRSYLKEATGRNPNGMLDEVRQQALGECFSGFGDVAGAGVVMKAAAGGAVAMVVGYVVADIVLFYWFPLVSGFLHPAILIGGVAAGVGIYLLKGDAWVREWIQGSVFDRIKIKLEEPETQRRVTSSLRGTCESILAAVADTFHVRAQEVLHEVRYQQRLAEEELAEHQKRAGSGPEPMRAELARLETVAAEAEAQLARLEVEISP